MTGVKSIKTGNELLGDWKTRLGQICSENGRTKAVDEWMGEIATYSVLAGILTGFLAGILTSNYFYITCFSLAGFFLPFLFFLSIEFLEFESRKRKKEDAVSDLLLSASVFPTGTPTQVLLEYCSRPDFGLLGAEFAKAQVEIEKGASVESALSNIKLRCESRIVDRALNLILLGYSTGCDLSQTFRQTAEDLLETQAILRERSATLLIEKFTILAAGGFLVPAILGLLTGLVTQLDFSAFGTLDIGLPQAMRKQLLDMALLGTQVYLVEYAVIAGFFVANQEGNWKKGIVYASVLVPLGLIAYVLAKG